MKLTTKIILGIILSIFILSIGLIIGLSFKDRERYDHANSRHTISQENIIEINVAPYKVVHLRDLDNTNNYNTHSQGVLYVKPLQNESDKNKLSIPEELAPYIVTQSSADTLTIMVDMHKIDDAFHKTNYFYTVVSGVNMYLYTDIVNIKNDRNGTTTEINNIKTDHIKVNSCGSVHIHSCKAITVEPVIRNYNDFSLKESTVKYLNIDLDQIGSWYVENCNIEVENLTGSNYNNVQLPKSEARVMNWLPKNKDSQLQLTLYGDTARVTFP